MNGTQVVRTLDVSAASGQVVRGGVFHLQASAVLEATDADDRNVPAQLLQCRLPP